MAHDTRETPRWLDRVHPQWGRWTADEARQRASYLATRRHLAPFLVPHRFEGDAQPEALRRAQYAYGIGINRAWLAEIMGHVRGAPATHTWGPLSEDPEATMAKPTGGLAAALWADATRQNTGWRSFFERQVQEWLLSSLGGFVLVDSPQGESGSQREEREAGIRPYVRWIPMSWVLDLGRSDTGFRWIKVAETEDTREPEHSEDEGLEDRAILYQLTEDGRTVVTRHDEDGNRLGDEADLGTIVDREGDPTLPLVHARFGEHPDIPWLGAGLLMGLDDIVIDLFNVLSEVREAYRDAAFGLNTFRGESEDFDKVVALLSQGTRVLHIGASTDNDFQRVSADASEVQAGLELIELGIRNWALSAKRKSAEAMERATARSGVSLQAEFELDVRPLLIEVTETLDEVESNAMWIVAQMAGQTVDQAEGIGVTRDTTFRPEDEAGRISRLVEDFVRSLPLPQEAESQLVMRWLEASGLVDMEAEIDGRPAVEVFEEQARQAVADRQAERERSATFFGGPLPSE